MSLLEKAKTFGGNLLNFAHAVGNQRFSPDSNPELEALAGPAGAAARAQYDRNFRVNRWKAIHAGAGFGQMNDAGHVGATEQYNQSMAQAIAVADALTKRRQESGRTTAISEYLKKNTSLTDSQREILQTLPPDEAAALIAKSEFTPPGQEYSVTSIGSGVAIKTNNRTGKYEIIRDAQAGAGGAGTMLSAEGLDLIAEQYLSTGRMPPGLTRGDKTIAARVMSRAAEIAASRGDSASEAVMRARANEANKGSLKLLSEQYHGVVAYETSMRAHLQNAVDIAKRVDKSGVPALDRWVLAGKKSIGGDPDVAALHVAITSAMDEYAKILSGGVRSAAAVTEGARESAEGMLSMASSLQQFLAVQKIIELDAEQKRIGLANQRQVIMGEMSAPGTETPQYGPGVEVMPTVLTPHPTPASPLGPVETSQQRLQRLRRQLEEQNKAAAP